MPIPNVGEELVDNEGVIKQVKAELLWEEYSIALVLEETDLNIDGIKIFTLTSLNELKMNYQKGFHNESRNIIRFFSHLYQNYPKHS